MTWIPESLLLVPGLLLADLDAQIANQVLVLAGLALRPSLKLLGLLADHQIHIQTQRVALRRTLGDHLHRLRELQTAELLLAVGAH